MNLTAWRNTEKRTETWKKQIAFAKTLCVPHEQFRQPNLNFFNGEKKSIMELAAICGLTYKDGKVG